LSPFSSAFYVCRNGRLRKIEGFDATSDGVLGYRNICCHRFVTDNQVEEYRAKVLGVSNKTGDSWHFRPNGKAPSTEGAFLVSATPPVGKPPGVGYLDGMGISSRSGKVTWRGCRVAWEVLPMGRWILLRQRGTQPGTLKYNFGHIGVRLLGEYEASSVTSGIHWDYSSGLF